MLSLAVLCCFLFVVVVFENKFYLNKCLNTLCNIKTEEGGGGGGKQPQISWLLHMALGHCC